MGVFLAIVFALGAKPVPGEVRLTPDEADKLVVDSPEPTYPPIAAQAKLQDTVRHEHEDENRVEEQPSSVCPWPNTGRGRPAAKSSGRRLNPGRSAPYPVQ